MNFNFEEITINTLSEYIKNVKKQDKEVTLESHLINDLDIDSLDTIELGFLIEEKFGIKVDFDKMMVIQLLTVQQVAEFFKSNYNDSSVQ
jgi:acyl carrier protein